MRHGESEANLRATAAQQAGTEVIEVAWRDADVPLSATGAEQASAFGRWFARARHGSAAPWRVWCSPYLRARQTAEIALVQASAEHAADVRPSDDPVPRIRVDERLRDRELGVLDLLTAVGVEARFPLEAARRRWVGKYYHRPPGGESWADVALRIRSFLGDLGATGDRVDGDDGPVLVIAHDAVVMLFVAVCTELDEQQLGELMANRVVANASVTRLVRTGLPSAEGPAWRVEAFGETAHLEAHGVATTAHQGDTDDTAR